MVPNDGSTDELDPLLQQLWPHVVERHNSDTIAEAPEGSLRARWNWVACDVLRLSPKLAADWWRGHSSSAA